MRARAYVKQLMKEAGLTIREDPMGSIYGERQACCGAPPSFMLLCLRPCIG